MSHPRQISLKLTAPIGEGKSVIAAIIRQALEAKGMKVILHRNVANIPNSRISDLDGSDPVEVYISEVIGA
jgi:hypothetical protein